MYPEVSPNCLRCKFAEGSRIHMFWLCPCLNKYWTEVFHKLSQVLQVKIEPNPLVGLFGVWEGSLHLSKEKCRLLASSSWGAFLKLLQIP